ncbi:hypothetical protein CEXT_234691 [Caerostris extrusa]|uniref:Uncharacterized protein n=1 Tax=Caerostris extrusa TaxID=172846 RepID=A0AAV4WCU0_CAEEX|nr:hypothetical protein CEXT_234691 [Caerostris extrusa]
MSRICKRFKDTGNGHRQSGQGRKHVTIDFQDHYLATIAKRKRQLQLFQIAREFPAATGTRLYMFTVNDRFIKEGSMQEKTLCKSLICIPLTPAAKCVVL